MESRASPDLSDNHDPAIIGTCVFMLVLTTASLALRIWSRVASRRADLWWDDWLSIASFPFLVALFALTLWWTSIGLGRHIQISPVPLSKHLLVFFAVNFIYNTGLTLIKLSVIFFYARIVGHQPIYRIVFWIAGTIIVAWNIAFCLLVAFLCTPVRKSWEPTVPGHCLNETTGMMGTVTSNIIIDVGILVLPLPMLWRLHVRRPHKTLLFLVFTSGYCVVIPSIVRLTTILGLGKDLDLDFSYNFTNAQLLVCIETGIALWSSCLPSIYQLMKRLFGSADPSLTSSDQDHAVRMGQLGNPIDQRKGFAPIREGRNGSGSISNAETLGPRGATVDAPGIHVQYDVNQHEARLVCA